MRIQFFAALILAIYLLLPGYLVLLAARVLRNRFLLSYGVSIGILILSLVPFLWFTGTINDWLVFLHVVILILVVGLLWYPKKRRALRRPRNTPAGPQSNRTAIWFLFLMLAYCIYHAIVGPYTEIPSDFWKHLARIGIEQSSIDSGEFGGFGGNGLFAYLSTSIGSSLIYVLQALVAHQLTVSPLALVPVVTLVTSAIFLASVYWFSISLFYRFFGNNHWVLISACLATLLTLLSFGTATFSYTRYYAYFPTILGFPLIYASIVVFVDFLERPRNRGWQLLLIPLFLLTMTFIHRQEALLTIIILGGITFVRGVRSFSPSLRVSGALISRARISLLLFLGLFSIFIIFTFTTRELTGWQNTPHIIDAGHFVKFLSNLPVDNPSFRLWDTLGIFGLLVYAWSIFNWRTLYRSDYLIAGMLVPIFTNLNPAYAIIFLHYGDPAGLWRTAYLTPLPMVATLLICSTLSSNIRWGLRHWKHSLGILMIAVLSLSLTPWSLLGYYNRTSRFPSLMPVHTQSGAGLWMDLIQSVQQIENTRQVRRIVTDEMTKFVLYAANRGQIWWWPRHEYFPKNRNIYKEDFAQSDLTETLLVVNRRNGAITASAQRAGHWPTQALNVARHYPKDLDSFLYTHKNHFELLWEFENIAIYQMNTFYE